MAGVLGEKAFHGEARPLSGYTIGDLAQILGVEPRGPRLIELGDTATITFLPGGEPPSVYIKDDSDHFKSYSPASVSVTSVEGGGAALVFRNFQGNTESIEVRDGGRDVRVVRPEKSAQIPSKTPEPSYFLP